MRIALIESVDGIPASVTAFKLSPEGRIKAVEHAVADAAARHKADPEKVRNEMTTVGDMIIGSYGYHICRIEDADC